MKELNKQKGFTLVEIIITLAVIGLVIVILSTLYVNSYKLIIYSGEKVQVVYDLQKQVEYIIGDQSYDVGESKTLHISFPNISRTISIDGKEVKFEKKYGNKKIALFYFIPYK
ncbi:type II secretion system GspH family protein [Alkaliphilus sp. MSJ-5]|uniref:Type II secretion system GspH family protein n=1 Tax=Alkaliphilus flagellatus TaxID=2841507 RepID=A0ABS6G516_9FIRM|nr:type II secretion system protein [Alkaliphilus flagellatus]MBU5677589.1 type II secretion system GspH family protein [Alkaliphilus flagellatus]